MQRCLAAIAAWTPPAASVVELYAGCGVIGLSLAARGAARRVVCVEVNPDSGEAFRVTQQALAASNPVRLVPGDWQIVAVWHCAALVCILEGGLLYGGRCRVFLTGVARLWLRVSNTSSMGPHDRHFVLTKNLLVCAA